MRTVPTDIGDVYCSDDEADMLTAGLLADGGYPDGAREAAFLEKHLGRGDVMFDVGAHIGLLSRTPAIRGVTVVAFEPDAENFALLKHNVPDVLAYELACGDQDGTVFLERSPRNSGDSRVHVSPQESHWALGATTSVEMVRLEPYVLKWQPRLVKTDAQGWDHRVVAGMGCQPVEIVLVGYSPHHIDAMGDDPQKVLAEYNANFNVSAFDPRWPFAVEPTGYLTLILRPCRPPERGVQCAAHQSNGAARVNAGPVAPRASTPGAPDTLPSRPAVSPSPSRTLGASNQGGLDDDDKIRPLARSG